jgi:metal-responsive CopG/Arc/MetJ family transcriptional regulator
MEYHTVKVPLPLAQRVERSMEAAGFRTISEFVIHATRDYVADIERAAPRRQR